MSIQPNEATRDAHRIADLEAEVELMTKERDDWRRTAVGARREYAETLDLLERAAAEVERLTELLAKCSELGGLGWAVKKAKARGEVEVLIANLEADAHAHHEETT